MRSPLRSGRTKLAAARRALCAFERQGHLVGTFTGFPSGRPSQGSGLSILTEPHDELASSLDHLVGALLQKPGHVEAERPCGLEVDNQLEFRGLLDRHIRRLPTLQNLDHKRGRPPKRVGTIGAVGQPPTSAKDRGTVAAGRPRLSASSAAFLDAKLPCTTTALAPSFFIAANASSTSPGPRTIMAGAISMPVALPAS